ncbi:Cys-tRNA(Pro)/Cys-tRNA(Cys) deacylase [Arthrobacter pigmenti]|uniref:Cys-tRNA(Pro)/Cys-tRNA(Cys) deacylase n=1 Tax=Arthrobacter pigmenti TaxID=271432 RepID=A0A846RTU4_9MICC|nr:Cys-tRNA(Pro) deacylase [Arthrobacter pigmenti]NJC23587.1 Cys-tRNA(Pro)/Cys-tRNA(Cys) deacylase [Arthrobacter pigmenti]
MAGGTPATALLTKLGVPYNVLSYSHDPSAEHYGTEAAEKLGAEPARVFKTLIVDLGGKTAVAVVPVNPTLDLKAMAAACGQKRAAMADPAVAQRRTGYVLGGISPLGQKQRSPLVLDESALRFDAILVSGGRRGMEIELAPEELLRATGGRTALIA